MRIVDMFHGSVFIIDPKAHKVMFEMLRTDEDFKLLTNGGKEIRGDKLYYIVANFALNA